MRNPYLPILVYFLLLGLTVPLFFDFLASDTPGWHTTIFPRYFILTIIPAILLLFTVLYFWLFKRRADKTSWILFWIHALLTIGAVIEVKFPTIFYDEPYRNMDQLIRYLTWRMNIFSTVRILFVSAQFLFFIYFVRSIYVYRKR
ncbi:MAG TPA: hypothetical protein VG890_01070 [Puia sp.]|nr:hypothetical protein [Puia sp.]